MQRGIASVHRIVGAARTNPSLLVNLLSPISMWWDVRLVLNVLNKQSTWEVHVPIDAYHLGLDLASERHIRQYRARLKGWRGRRIAESNNDDAIDLQRCRNQCVEISTSAESPSLSFTVNAQRLGRFPQVVHSHSNWGECACSL